jgi:hypothetical protein
MMSMTVTEGGKRVTHDLDSLVLNGHPAARLPADALNRQLRALGVPGVDPGTGFQDGLLCLSRYQKAQAEAEEARLRRLRDPEAAA